MGTSFNSPDLPQRKAPGISKPLNGALGIEKQTALEWSATLPNADLVRRIISEALDALNVAVLVTDASRHLLLANNRAEQILATRDGLQRSVLGTLEASRPSERATFEALLNHADLLAHTVHSRSKNATLAIQREPGRRPLTIVAQPLERSESLDCAVLMFVLDPERSLGASEGELRQLHGITAREARLANLLMEGNTLEECCGLLDIQTSTARMHLGSLFAKTGAQRQSQLVSILLSSLGAIDVRSAEGSVSSPKQPSPESYRDKVAILLGASMEAFNRLEMGVAVTDAGWQLLFANRTANRLLQARDGVELTKQGTLRTLQNPNALGSRIGSNRGPARIADRVSRNTVISVERRSAKRPLTLMVRQIEHPASDRPCPAFLIFMLDPERPLCGAEEGLRQLYSLTRCEARLANLLMDGNALDACCEQLNIRYSTARMHLSNLFAKTGVQRQGQLISLLVKSLGILRYQDLSTPNCVNLTVESRRGAQSGALKLNRWRR